MSMRWSSSCGMSPMGVMVMVTPLLHSALIAFSIAWLLNSPFSQWLYNVTDLRAHRVLYPPPWCIRNRCHGQATPTGSPNPNIRIIMMIGVLGTMPLAIHIHPLYITIIFIPLFRTCSINLCKCRPLPMPLSRGIFANPVQMLLTTLVFMSTLPSLLAARSYSSVTYHPRWPKTNSETYFPRMELLLGPP